MNWRWGHLGSHFPFAGDTSTYNYNGAQGDGFEWSVQGGGILEGRGDLVDRGLGDDDGAALVTLTESDPTGCEGEVVRPVNLLEPNWVPDLPLFKLTIMPNPASDWVSLDWDHQRTSMLKVEVLDAKGASVLQTVATNRRVGGLAPGMYVLKASCDLGQTTLPLIVK